MTLELWSKVDEYLDGVFTPEDPALTSAIAASAAAGLPDIAVSASQGALLNILVKAIGAGAVLEIGTLGGYSTIFIARALGEGGRMISLEREPRFVEVAKANIAHAGLTDRVEILTGDAIDLLPKLAARGQGRFDFTFIDADKTNNAKYFDWAVCLSRPGALIVVDNVIRGGRVTDEQTADPSIRGTRQLNEAVAADCRVETTTIQTVGAKGYDGFMLARVL